MYINAEILKASGVGLKDFGLLVLIAGNKIADNSQMISENVDEEMLSMFEEDGLVEYVKPKNKQQTKYNCIRITKKGREFIEDVCTPLCQDGDLQMATYLMSMYMAHEDTDRKVGNKKTVKMCCAEFRQYLGLTLHEMYYLCEMFLSEHVYTKVLDRIFIDRKKNPYSKFLNVIDEAPLMQYYEANKERIEQYWKERIK